MIDALEILEHLRAVVAAKGADYVYSEETCQYAIDGQPACIAGHVYARLGLLDQATCDSGAEAHHLHAYEITLFGRDVLRAAQQVQDSVSEKRGTWGEALVAAEEIGMDR